jgi:hypothetical protein
LSVWLNLYFSVIDANDSAGSQAGGGRDRWYTFRW